ncbi:hypothetical protein WA026_004622 [Henosepilachna vigintioctopunctata]|uniref:DNA-directed RNA polymerase III subunit RPC4 n=1 Tax=Henosepilachna vigintioctopunctata TaxID=420089 RepID=A0AAW1V7F3_9CUCU
MDAKLLKNLMKKKPEEPTNNRLQSLRLPRDLSLGGTKPKKTYAPNLNVVRNKDKAKEVLKNLDRKRKERVKTEPKNRQFGDSQRYVQSTGIFSDGAAEQRRSTAHSERSFHSKSENDPSGVISVPTYNKYKWNVDSKKEDSVFEELIKDEEIEDEKEEKMPLLPLMWENVGNKGLLSKIKIENELNGDSREHVAVRPKVHPFFSKLDEGQGNVRLSLMKLPDSLAGKGLSDDPNVKKIFDFPLNVMLEGKIGTLQLKRSGKMYITIGHVKYLLESTDFFSSKESIAAFTKPSLEKDQPQFAVFGNVEHRFVVNPMWNCLLKS